MAYTPHERDVDGVANARQAGEAWYIGGAPLAILHGCGVMETRERAGTRRRSGIAANEASSSSRAAARMELPAHGRGWTNHRNGHVRP
jgi:hypothetical protein